VFESIKLKLNNKKKYQKNFCFNL